MAETDRHREIMVALIKILQAYFASDPMVYVSGNLLVYYVPGNRRRHVSPDVFVVKGVAKHERPNYLVWKEGKPPNLVIEVTSSSTRDEDLEDKFELYRDQLQVDEYFLFDPQGDYLNPPLQGYRLQQERYVPIERVAGRLPSEVLGLHLEQHETDLRLFHPQIGQWLPTPEEKIAQSEAENQRLRQELEQLRQQLTQHPQPSDPT
jgi:Uma2 family endonuclease